MTVAFTYTVTNGALRTKAHVKIHFTMLYQLLILCAMIMNYECQDVTMDA